MYIDLSVHLERHNQIYHAILAATRVANVTETTRRFRSASARRLTNTPPIFASKSAGVFPFGKGLTGGSSPRNEQSGFLHHLSQLTRSTYGGPGLQNYRRSMAHSPPILNLPPKKLPSISLQSFPQPTTVISIPLAPIFLEISTPSPSESIPQQPEKAPLLPE